MKSATAFVIGATAIVTIAVLANREVGLSPATPAISGGDRADHLWLVFASMAIVVTLAGSVSWLAWRRPVEATDPGQGTNHRWLPFFGVVAIVQVGHLGEHGAQLTQLLMSGGTLAESHGVAGRLDFETVHFSWDTCIWISTLLLTWRYGPVNSWLWLSLFFASAHEVEHMYLYYINLFELDFYMNRGGFAGVLGQGGILPTVERLYLHVIYNFMVVVPFVIAFCKQVAPLLTSPRVHPGTVPGGLAP